MSEDCLYLNIWSPGADQEKRPVMVYIHGGAFTLGSASDPWYVHCLNRNLTVRSSRNTLSGIIVAFSTIPPLHQFPFAEKTGSLYNVLKGSDFS
jgi:hypothetical protein